MSNALTEIRLEGRNVVPAKASVCYLETIGSRCFSHDYYSRQLQCMERRHYFALVNLSV